MNLQWASERMSVITSQMQSLLQYRNSQTHATVSYRILAQYRNSPSVSTVPHSASNNRTASSLYYSIPVTTLDSNKENVAP